MGPCSPVKLRRERKSAQAKKQVRDGRGKFRGPVITIASDSTPGSNGGFDGGSTRGGSSRGGADGSSGWFDMGSDDNNKSITDVCALSFIGRAHCLFFSIVLIFN